MNQDGTKGKLTWQERVVDTARVHKRFLQSDSRHTLQNTADLLNRSIGSISEDLTIADWIKTHPKILEMQSLQDALKFIREKKLEMRMR